MITYAGTNGQTWFLARYFHWERNLANVPKSLACWDDTEKLQRKPVTRILDEDWGHRIEFETPARDRYEFVPLTLELWRAHFEGRVPAPACESSRELQAFFDEEGPFERAPAAPRRGGASEPRGRNLAYWPRDTGDPPRMRGKRCPRCDRKLVHVGPNGQLKPLKTRCRVEVNQDHRRDGQIEVEIETLVREAAAVEETRGLNSAEHRRLRTLLAEKRRELVLARMALVIVICRKCQLRINPSDDQIPGFMEIRSSG
jgi:hypothetical protein